MTTEPRDTAKDVQEKEFSDHVEVGAEMHETELYALRQRFPLLADASQEKLDALNKAVMRKLDWRFLPVITLMLLMR